MKPRYRFGRFEFDAEQLVLRRDSSLVRLQSQPARVLACLLENRGRVVSREELHKAIWGESTYVEFNAGLNFCITQVRAALGDDASSPIYVGTVPKLGYQFIAPVEEVPNAKAQAAPSIVPAAGRSGSSIRMLALAALIVLAFVAGYQLRSHSKASSLPIIAVARFDNETGDPNLNRFADSLGDNLVERLTTSGQGQFAVIGNAQLLRLPREQRDLSVIGARLNAKYIVLGQVLRSGQSTRILAHLIRLPEQTHLWVSRTDIADVATNPDGNELAQKIAAAFTPRVAADVRGGYSSPGLGR
jgi:DNA-binding winged helix-turn-helix (wHTH) protein/TolB-like protein